MYEMYSTSCFGLEIHEIYKKNHYGPEITEFFQRKLLIVKIISKIKLRVLNFGYVVTVDRIIMNTNLQMKLWVLYELQYTSFIIDSNELKLAGCTKGSVVNISIKFEVILKKLIFSEI